MLVTAFFQWWYGPGWRDAASRISRRVQHTYLSFSLPVLLRTMFAPWRRIITPPGESLDQKFKASIDNLVSRAVGFTMRLCLLIAAGVIMASAIIAGGILVTTWPLLPILGPALIITGLII